MPSEAKERCSRGLKRGLAFSLGGLCLLLWWLEPFSARPSVPRTFWGLFDRHEDCVSFQDCRLYSVGETTIYLQRRNFLDLENGQAGQALGLSGKLNLSPPFIEGSLDFKLRGRIEKSSSCGQLKPALFDSFEQRRSDDPKWLAGVVRKGHWVLDLTAEPCFGEGSWNLNGWRVFYLAGISARPKKGEASLMTERKPRIIAGGVEELCRSARDVSVEELLVGFIGTGAAGVDKVRAADAILNGINRAAFTGKAPSSVVIGIFPERLKIKSGEPEDEWRKKDAEFQARWNETGEVFRTIVQAPLTDPDLEVWSYLHIRTRAFQVLLILLSSLASALVAVTLTLPDVQIRATAVAHKAALWAFVASGLLSLKTFTLGDPRPLSWLTVLIVSLLAFLAPLWSWHGLDKVPGLSDESVCRYPPPSNTADPD